MAGDGKSKLDYFMERTDERLDGFDTRFEGISERLDRLWKFGVVAVLLCVAFSPKGEKLLEIIPKFLELAVAGPREAR